MQTKILKVITAVLILFTPTVGTSGTKVLDYGFEDFSGYNGNASPADGYPFSSAYEESWVEHTDGTIVTQGGVNCDGNTARSGDYYWHRQFYTGASDSCIGGTPSSINPGNYIGLNGAYPTGTKDDLSFPTDIDSDTIVLRFYMRTVGDWTSNQASIDGGGGLKFVRLYGDDGSGDDSTALLKLLCDGDSSDPRFLLIDIGVDIDYISTGVNWQDGNWHSVVFRAVRNNDTNSSGNCTITFWIDDWDMSGDGYSKTITVSDFGSSFHHISLAGNWSASYPSTGIALDFDDFEIWDGMPDNNGSSSLTSGSGTGGKF